MNNIKSTDKGVIYCAVQQKKYFFLSLLSAIQFTQLNPDVPATIVTDLTLAKFLIKQMQPHNITIQLIDKLDAQNPFLSRIIKTNIYKYSPYQNTLFLDSDVLPLKNFEEIWSVLKQWDLAMVREHIGTLGARDYNSFEEGAYTQQNYPASCSDFNTGLLLFKKNLQNETLFKTWLEEWKRYKLFDHFAFMRACYDTQTQIFELDRKYNMYPNEITQETLGKIVFLHISKMIITWEQTFEIIKTLCPDTLDIVKNILHYSDSEILSLGKAN